MISKIMFFLIVTGILSFPQSTWVKTYGYNKATLSSIIEIQDGYLIAGGNITNLFILKADKLGNISNEIIYGKDDLTYNSVSLVPTIDNNFLLAAHEYSSSQGHVVLIKIDSSGNKIWSKTVVDSGISIDNPVIQNTSDGNYILSYTDYSSNEQNYSLILTKIN